MAYIDPSASYPLCPGVRARREEFGLLFYNSRDAKLTFVNCGQLLILDRKGKDRFVIASSIDAAEEQRKTRGYIASLLKKGLIGEPASCA